MKPWMLVSIGAVSGSVVTAAGAYVYLHRAANFLNDMQYVSAAAHVVAYHDTLQDMDGGATDRARSRIDVLLQGSEALMKTYELELDREGGREPPTSKVVRDAKQRLELYPREGTVRGR